VIREKLAAADQTDIQLQRDLASTYEKLAAVDLTDGSAADAAASLRKAVALRERAAAVDQDNTPWQIDLILSLYWLGQTGDDPQSHYQEALVLAEKLDNAGRLNPRQKALIASLQQALAAP
jgi:hypothetical protein